MNLAIFVVVLSAVVALAQSSGPYGLAQTPPMGWRTWNAYHNSVSQDKMLKVIDKMTERTRTVGGKLMSLVDLGYVDVGLDDNWQACGSGVNGSFHDENGNPLVNTVLFPSIGDIPKYAHSKGASASFYMNNCDCRETQFTNPAYIQKVYERSVAFIVDQQWDGVKLDGCSEWKNTTLWANLMNATGRPMMVENCHNTNAPSSPTEVEPYNWYRVSGDIGSSITSVFNNLQASLHYRGYPPLSRPTCWAYSDMLEVGNLPTVEQSRTHFGAWAVTSNPLILGYDVLNENKTDALWPFISNLEVIAVNQRWAGHPGQLTKTYPQGAAPNVVQLWTKPQPNSTIAAFFFSYQDHPNEVTLTVNFKELNITTTQASVRDLWLQKDLGVFTNSFTTDAFGGYDSRFYLFTPKP